jgi:hypothetical protein
MSWKDVFFGIRCQKEKVKVSSQNHFFERETTTMMNRLLIATLALSCFAISHGFAPAFHSKKLAFKNVCQELKSTSVLSSSEYQDEVTMMIQARECAFSDEGSADEARSFLHQILHVQSGCVSGVLSGHDLCENQDDVAEIVAHLRQKAESGAAALR